MADIGPRRRVCGVAQTAASQAAMITQPKTSLGRGTRILFV